MANNFKNAFASIVSAGEFYQSTGSATDNAYWYKMSILQTMVQVV